MIPESASGGIQREAVTRLEIQELLNRALSYVMLVVAVDDASRDEAADGSPVGLS